MFLSIIIPVYNMEKYLYQCLESCYDQNLNYNDYEVICINDGSCDRSLDILNDYSMTHSNLIIIDQPNMGVSAARNRGIEQARGDYIWFVDADDCITPDSIQSLRTIAIKEYDIISFAGFHYNTVLSEEQEIQIRKKQLIGNMSYWGFVALHLYRSKLIRNYHVSFRTDISYGEDELFFLDALSNADSVLTTEDLFYLYRGHEQSAMNKLKSPENQLKRLESVLRSMVALKERMENGGYVQKEAQDLLKGRYKVCPYLFAPLNKKQTKYYLEFIRENDLFNRDFLRKYGLLSEAGFHFLYRKERYYDKTVSFIKRVLPDSVIKSVKSNIVK